MVAAISSEALRARLLELQSSAAEGAASLPGARPAAAARQAARGGGGTDSSEVPSTCETLCIVSWDDEQDDEKGVCVFR
jgi:hypothetical protein